MRILIVDDEAPARARLRRLLVPIAGVEVVGEAADAVEALQQVEVHRPDLLLLDVQMPGASGLDLAASLADPVPAMVFVTAFDQYALRAFEVAAIDYLLKPVDPEKLARALRRWEQRSAMPTAHPVPRQLLIADRGRTHVVPVAEIGWLEAADNYVVVHAGERMPLMRRSLSALVQDLGPGFLRVHRGAAVAVAQIVSVQARDKGDVLLLLRDGGSVPCSRSYRVELMERLRGCAVPVSAQG